MKKSIFILAALFIAAFANAQITLEHIFDEIVYAKTPYFGDAYDGIDAPYLYSYTKTQLKLYDKNTYSLYKTVTFTLPDTTSSYVNIGYITRNIFTLDGKVSFILYYEEHSGYSISNRICRIIDEDGNVIFDFNNQYLSSTFSLFYVEGTYKLLVREDSTGNPNPLKTYLYSLPGNGEPSTDIVSPTSSKRSARKIAREGQVLVEAEKNLYTIQGQQVQ